MKQVLHSGTVKLLVRSRPDHIELFNPHTDKSEFLLHPTTVLPLAGDTPVLKLLPSMTVLEHLPPSHWLGLRERRKAIALAGASKKRGEDSQSFDHKVDEHRGSKPKAGKAKKPPKLRPPPQVVLVELLKLPLQQRLLLAQQMGYSLGVQP